MALPSRIPFREERSTERSREREREKGQKGVSSPRSTLPHARRRRFQPSEKQWRSTSRAVAHEFVRNKRVMTVHLTLGIHCHKDRSCSPPAHLSHNPQCESDYRFITFYRDILVSEFITQDHFILSRLRKRHFANTYL